MDALISIRGETFLDQPACTCNIITRKENDESKQMSLRLQRLKYELIRLERKESRNLVEEKGLRAGQQTERDDLTSSFATLELTKQKDDGTRIKYMYEEEKKTKRKKSSKKR